jgi:OmpA-OmpF porin, OOP family
MRDPAKIYLYIIPVVFPLYFFSVSTAQNLVPNPSFEIFDKCPKDYNIDYKKVLVTGWYMPTGGTPDYFNICAKEQVGVPQNFMGNCLAKDGGAYVGVILILDPSEDTIKQTPVNYREYIGTKLNEPLLKGERYVVKLHYSIATNSAYAVNRLGAYFSETKIGNKLFTRILDYKPQVYVDTTQMFMEKENWYEMADTFQAKGNEQYMTIGNFYDDKHTWFKPINLAGLSRLQQAKIKESKLAYYYIDLVSVSKIQK